MTVSRLHLASLLLIFTGLFVGFFAYYHVMYLQNGDLGLASFLAGILAGLNPAPTSQETALVPGASLLTERSAIQFWFSVAVFLPLLALCLSLFHRYKYGAATLFIPLCFASVATVGSILKVAYEIRVFWGT